LKTKIIPVIVIIIGTIILVTSLNYASSIVKSEIHIPETIIPQLEMSEINATKIKLPIVNNVKISINKEVSDSESNKECVGNTLCITDTVTKIIDGDTIDTKQYRVRLALVDTPEKYESGFSDATSFTSNLCPVGSSILIDQDDGQKIDKYGRIIAKVTCSGTNLNSALLENNHAGILNQYCSESEFAMESWAKRFGC